MVTNILKGIKAYFGTLSLISKLKLWKYFVIPVSISLLTGINILVLAFSLSDNVAQLIIKFWIWDWGANTFGMVSQVIGGLLILVLGFVFHKHIVMALSAPFMSPVSQKIEKHLLGKTIYVYRETTFMQQLLRGIRINFRNLLRELSLIIPLILLSFIPVIGVVFTILIFLVQAYYVGFGNMDYTMERHFDYKESIQFVKQHSGTAIGNGIIFMCLLFIPVIGFVLSMPIAVVAASTETVRILHQPK